MSRDNLAAFAEIYMRQPLEPWQRELLDKATFLRESGRTFAGFSVIVDSEVRRGTLQLRSETTTLEYDSATGSFREIMKGPTR